MTVFSLDIPALLLGDINWVVDRNIFTVLGETVPAQCPAKQNRPNDKNYYNGL